MRTSAWRARARTRAALALGSALACAIVTSALLLSGSVRALRGAVRAEVSCHDTPVVADAALYSAPAARSATGDVVSASRTVPRSGAVLGSRAERALEIIPPSATRASSIDSRSRGSDVARGYDAMAPPGERA